MTVVSNIDWSKAPEGAVALKLCEKGQLRWFNAKGEAWFGNVWDETHFPYDITIATRPAEPNIIEVKDMKKGMVVRCVESDCFWYSVGREYHVGIDRKENFGPLDEDGEVSPWLDKYKFELVSEPENRKTAEHEWTHATLIGKCRVLIDVPDRNGHVVVEYEQDGYSIANPDSLRPIKQKITKAQAWDLFVNEGWSTTDIMDKHEVLE